jgi:hypothetical protein
MRGETTRGMKKEVMRAADMAEFQVGTQSKTITPHIPAPTMLTATLLNVNAQAGRRSDTCMIAFFSTLDVPM